MNELIAIESNAIGGRHTPTVNLRDLHGLLEVKTPFSMWVRRRISECEFKEGRDYLIIYNKFVKNNGAGRPEAEYYGTLDMGKHLGMLEKTEMGFKVREYFIACEQKALTTIQPMSIKQVAQADLLADLAVADALGVPLHIAQVEAVKDVHLRLGVDFRPMLKHAPAQSNIPDSEVYLEPTELAGRLSAEFGIPIKASGMNKLLEEWGMQVRTYDRKWQATAAGEAISQRHQWAKGSKRGYNLVWHYASVMQLARQFIKVKKA